MRSLSTLGACVGLALILTPAASAKTIDVKPKGPSSDALQRAIDKAGSGDRLRLHAGVFHEAVAIDKRLKIFAAKGSRPVIDAGCDSSITVDVLHPGVSIEGLKVKGTLDAFAINFNNVSSGRVHDMRLTNDCGLAQYGVNVFNSGRIRISDSKATGFVDSGYYIGGIDDTSNGALIVRDNVATANNRGIIVEDSVNVDVRIINNVLDRNTYDGANAEGIASGIYVNNSDEILFEANRTDANGVYGINVNATSDDNVFSDNESSANDTDNFFDEGAGNCGSGNSFPLPAC